MDKHAWSAMVVFTAPYMFLIIICETSIYLKIFPWVNPANKSQLSIKKLSPNQKIQGELPMMATRNGLEPSTSSVTG